MAVCPKPAGESPGMKYCCLKVVFDRPALQLSPQENMLAAEFQKISPQRRHAAGGNMLSQR